MHQYCFKIATEDGEFDQIHQMNYRTFVEEIPQHPPTPDKRLVDRFHEENAYVICLEGGKVVAMSAVRDRRPFSLDLKLTNLDSYLPQGRTVCEVRLLAVDPAHRRGEALPGLLDTLVGFCLKRGYNLALISGTVLQQRLYRHLGFVPFGPLVGSREALFQPMYLTLEAYRSQCRKGGLLSGIANGT